jgi:hypothetical protein
MPARIETDRLPLMRQAHLLMPDRHAPCGAH